MSNRKFGIELEFGLNRRTARESRNIYEIRSRYPEVFRQWGIGHDGTEYELRSPALAPERLPEVVRLVRTLTQERAFTTERDGLHVHHDMSHETKQTTINLFKFWLTIEPHMYRLVHARRTHGEPANWCQAWRDYNYSMREWRSFISHTEMNEANLMDEYRNEHGYTLFDEMLNDRYYGLNFEGCYDMENSPNALTRFRNGRTVEFRLHEGTLDWRIISRWVNLTRRVVDLGVRYRGPVRSLNTNQFVRVMGRRNLGTRLLRRLRAN